MISIIIPTYNYARFLPDAIESALAQSVPDGRVEVLVVDDGSTDNTPEVLARYGTRVRCVRQANAGLSAARNTGMREASHDWVVFLDSDDMLASGSVEGLWKTRDKIGRDCVLIASRDRSVGLNKEPLGPDLEESGKVSYITARSLVLRNRFACAVLADRRRLLDLGGFDTTLRASEDRDMWIRVAARHPVVILDQVSLLRRVHGDNMSRAAARQTAAIEQVLAKAFANPDLHLTGQDRRMARAVCLYQSALMYSDAGKHRAAAWQMLRSLLVCPCGSFSDAEMPSLSRLRGLAGNLRRFLR